MSTVPIFAPDGTLGDIPAGQLVAAVKAGAKPGVHIVAPDGSKGVIPADRTADAVKAGAKVEAFQDQPAKGFWSQAGSALWNDIKSIPSAITAPDPLADPGVSDQEKSRLVAQSETNAQAKNDQRTKEHGLGYSLGATANEMMGVNVEGEEQAAREGNPGAVVGHAATVPAVMAATAGVGKVAEGIKASPTAQAMAAATPSAVSAALKKLPVAAIQRIPYLGQVLSDVYKAGRDAYQANKVAPQASETPLTPAQQAEGENWREPDTAVEPPVSAAPAAAPPAAAPAATTAETAAPAASDLSGSGIPRTLSGESALRQVIPGNKADLMKIAKSRGISTTREAQLVPAAASKSLIDKIVDDFSPEELDAVRSQYIEETRMGHSVPQISETLEKAGLSKAEAADRAQEAWNVMKKQTYFPDLQIPMKELIRSQQTMQMVRGAIKPNPMPATGALGEAAAAIKKSAQAAQAPRTVVIDPTTGQPEFSDVMQARQPQVPRSPDEGVDLMQQSIAQANARRALKKIKPQ